MNKINITLYEAKTKTIDIEYPLYLTNQRKDEFYMFIGDDMSYKVVPMINAIVQCREKVEYALNNGYTFITKAEFDTMLEATSKNIDTVYEAILHAQSKAVIFDTLQDLQDAKTQEQLENYLGK
jgi:hypothetical protein